MSERHEDALLGIKQWCDAYPTTVFRPLTPEQLQLADKVLRANGIDLGAMHAHWARHIIDSIRLAVEKGLEKQ